jgi:hypothetical protein
VTRPFLELDSTERASVFEIDGDDLPRARVRDERLATGGMCRRIARLSKAVYHPPERERPAVEDAHSADRGVAHERVAASDELDAARIRRARDAADDSPGADVDDGETLVDVAGGDGEEGRGGANRLGTEQCRGRGQTEESTAIHDPSTAAEARQVLRAIVAPPCGSASPRRSSPTSTELR